jgi:hypothetical protein
MPMVKDGPSPPYFIVAACPDRSQGGLQPIVLSAGIGVVG